MSKIITKEHDYYYTPNDGMCSRMLTARKLDPSNSDFMKELSRFFYHQMIESKDYIEDRYLEDNFTEEMAKDEEISPERLAQKREFYHQLFDEYVPGYSPTEKAVNALRMISKSKKPKNKDGEPDLADALTQIRENKVDRETFENPNWNKLLNKRSLDEFDKKMDHLNKVAIIEGFGKSFEIKKTTEDRKVPNSRKFKSVRMSEYSEITKSPIYQKIFPNYSIKLATKDLVINAPIETQEGKQKIIILVDYSGSMNETYKQDWVLAIIADRLYYAMKEECEIFFSYFLENLYPKRSFTHIYNEETALKFFKDFQTRPDGGDTYVGNVIRSIKDEIEKNHRLFNLNVDLSKEKPEILVINDGNDSCKVDNFTWKTNAITLGQRNEELKKLSEASGGRYLTIDRNDKISD